MSEERASELDVARRFIDATRAKDADAVADLCADDVEVLLPGAGAALKGRDGVRQMIRLAPELQQSFRSEEQRGHEVRVTTLTRAPGIFANYTTWVFTIEDAHVRRLTFELRAAN